MYYIVHMKNKENNKNKNRKVGNKTTHLTYEDRVTVEALLAIVLCYAFCMARHTKSIFIFRRDMRLVDNAGLHYVLGESERVLPVFIFDPVQCDPKQNKYFSPKAFGFLLDSLEELDAALRRRGSHLYCYSGKSSEVLAMLLQKEKDVAAVYVNSDYTPFARKRDEALMQVCEKNGVAWNAYHDYTLAPVAEIHTQQGKPYSVFTPFYKNAVSFEVAPPLSSSGAFVARANVPATVSLARMRVYGEWATRGAVRGGRSHGLRLLKDAAVVREYEKKRNTPEQDATSHLSAHHKFGTVSVRETYRAARSHAGSNAEAFIRQLYWRDFYYHIAWHFPQVFGKSFLSWGENMPWRTDADAFSAWKNGATGVPLVDAGMRELNETGYMHNRVRMVVASFLTKHLLIDWREGERYFAQKLIDYDPAVNNGSWQWAASVGADPRPLRIFNPYIQTKRYDPNAAYIHKHVPELRGVSAAVLANGKPQDVSLLASEYPAPIVEHRTAFLRAKEAFRQAKR